MRIYGWVLLAVAAAGIAITSPAVAGQQAFFEQIEGKWRGNGEIVAGKYKGTRFRCRFDGLTAAKLAGMDIDGSCRVGMFSQKMNAVVRHASGRYSGKFLDGAKGEGMDVVSGRYRRNKLIVNIKRKQLVGVMVATLNGSDELGVTISVKVQQRYIPVIGMTLKRTSGSTKTTSLQ